MELNRAFLWGSFENNGDFGLVKPILVVILKMRNSGESLYFRIGSSMYALMISRLVNHGLRYDQKEIRIERINDISLGFEYALIPGQ